MGLKADDAAAVAAVEGRLVQTEEGQWLLLSVQREPVDEQRIRYELDNLCGALASYLSDAEVLEWAKRHAPTVSADKRGQLQARKARLEQVLRQMERAA